MKTGYESAFLAEAYDRVVPYRSRTDLEFFVGAALDSGGPVLELGCGTGRVLIPTARAGIAITGLDASTPMLDVCRARLDREADEVRVRVRLVQGRLQDFELDEKFALVTTPFRPFQHLLTVEDQISCLKYAHAHVRDGGRFVLDVFNPWVHRLVDELGAELDAEPAFMMTDGRSVVRKHRIVSRDLFDQIIDIEIIHEVTHPDGSSERVVQPIKMRYLYRFEAEHLLARCGFELEAVYADYDKSAYGSKYPGELILVARKI